MPHPFLQHLEQTLQQKAKDDLLRTVPCIDTKAQHRQLFCSNDYLGLSQHPQLIQALADGAAQYGAGSCASHLISGHTPAHQTLEDAITAWMRPIMGDGIDTLTFSTGYMANVGVLTALADKQTTIFSDKLNHASIVDGCRLAKSNGCTVRRYRHVDMQHLQTLLEQDNNPRKIIVSDGVFSMDGNIAPVAELLDLAQTHDALLIIDDAHGIGVLGADGQGSLAHVRQQGYNSTPLSSGVLLMGTLGKGAGIGGAFVAAHATLVQYLVQSARSYIYTTAQPPAIAHALTQSITLMQGADGAARREQLQMLIAHFRHGVQAIIAPYEKCHLMDSPTPIQPLVVGSNANALALMQQLKKRGLHVPAIRPPTVPEGSARLRFTLHAEHRIEDIDGLLEALSHALAECD